MKKKIAAVILLSSVLLSIFTHSAYCQGSSEEMQSPHRWYIKRREKYSIPEVDKCAESMQLYSGCYHDAGAYKDQRKVIYLTFDVGYVNESVVSIIDTLNKYDVRAGFFVLAHFIRSAPELVTEIIEQGHLMCNHTSQHPDMSKLKKDEFLSELGQMEKIALDATGQPLSKFYRPPQGHFTMENLMWAKEAGYTTVFWSMCHADWDNANQPDPSRAIELLTDYVHPGAIILLHPNSATNAAILPTLIEQWRSMGYTFATIDNIMI